MLRIFEKIVDNYKVDPGKLDSLVLRKGLALFFPAGNHGQTTVSRRGPNDVQAMTQAGN